MPIATLAADAPLNADQGGDFHFVVTYSDTNGNKVDLTQGWSARFEWSRNQAGYPQGILTNDNAPGGSLVLGDGVITGLVPAVVTATWDFEGCPFRIVVISPTGATDVLLEGVVKLNAFTDEQ